MTVSFLKDFSWFDIISCGYVILYRNVRPLSNSLALLSWIN